MTKKLIIALAIIMTLIVVFLVAEFLYIRSNGAPVPAPTIPREPMTFGTGKKLTYVVMGDSTTIAQGANYEDGYSLISAKYLGQKYETTYINTGISGATVESTRVEQLDSAKSYRPDIVLLAVGANDTTHFTGTRTIRINLQSIIDGLREANPDVRIVVTRSPALDSVSRFPIGAKQIMQWRTKQVNDAFAPIIDKNNLILAPIAEETRDAFLADPTLTAEDKFHPNARGYALWVPVINAALDEALADY